MPTTQQPPDEWDFVRPDGDDDDPSADPAAEEDALHDAVDGLLPTHDPARSDDSAEADDGDDGPPATYFDDEEPEQARWRAEREHEPDLEEILESQHYAFRPEPDDGD